MSVKQLLFKVLQDAVGDFVVGLTPDSLKLGLWSGEIELKDLEVNVEAIKKLGLPLELKEGRIALLTLDIPWSSLGSSPVRVKVQGVKVVAAPDATELSADAIAEAVAGDAARCAERKNGSHLRRGYDMDRSSHEPAEWLISAQVARRLKRTDAARESALLKLGDNATEESGSSYAQRLTAKIVDNLEVTISDVSVVAALGGETAGLALKRLELRACDETWTPAFVDKKEATGLLRNLVALEGLAVSWDAGDVLA